MVGFAEVFSNLLNIFLTSNLLFVIKSFCLGLVFRVFLSSSRKRRFSWGSSMELIASKKRSCSLVKVLISRISSLSVDDEMSDGFFEAIEELERMTREPSDVLEEMNDGLSARELQLVLVYFSQDGRDSWCALEVFDWLRKENRVDKETMELMVAIMCGWVKKLIQEHHGVVGDVVDLLVDMDCVGLRPGFSMI